MQTVSYVGPWSFIRGSIAVFSMNRKTLGQIALIVSLAILSVWLFRRSSDRRKIDLNPYQALGAVAAEETSKLLGQQGEIIIVMPDAGSDRDPVMDAQLAAFQSGLKKAGKVSVRSTETVKMDPFLSMRTGGAMPAEQFLGLSKKHPDAAAFVLFIGFPALGNEEMAKLKTCSAKRIVISAAIPGYEDLIEQGIIHLAIVPRARPADQTLPPAKTTRETFDQEYLILAHDTAP